MTGAQGETAAIPEVVAMETVIVEAEPTPLVTEVTEGAAPNWGLQQPQR
jgi:hypothetical protein